MGENQRSPAVVIA